MTLPKQPHATDAEKRPSIHASLVLRGFTNSPSELSAILGLTPRRTGRPGEPYLAGGRTPTGRVIKEAYWALGSDLDHRAALEDHIGSIVERTRSARQALKTLPPNVRAVVSCTVIPNGDLPLFVLDSALLSSLAELRCSLELDIVSVEADVEETD